MAAVEAEFALQLMIWVLAGGVVGAVVREAPTTSRLLTMCEGAVAAVFFGALFLAGAGHLDLRSFQLDASLAGAVGVALYFAMSQLLLRRLRAGGERTKDPPQ